MSYWSGFVPVLFFDELTADGTFIAITMQPTIAANNNMLITSKGNAYPPLPIPVICNPIFETVQLNSLVAAWKLCWLINTHVSANPNRTDSSEATVLIIGGFGIFLPACWVRKMEKMTSTTIPPTYTMIWTAAINSTWSRKYKPAMPVKENRSQIADRKIFLLVTERTAVLRIKAASR